MEKEPATDEGLSISNLRGAAQEKSTEAIRAAEERYHKAKEHGGEKGGELEDISKMRGAAQQKSMETIRAAEERYHKAKDTGGSAADKAN